MQPLFPLNNIGGLSGVCSRQQTPTGVVFEITASSDSLLFGKFIKTCVPAYVYEPITTSAAHVHGAGV